MTNRLFYINVLFVDGLSSIITIKFSSKNIAFSPLTLSEFEQIQGYAVSVFDADTSLPNKGFIFTLFLELATE